MLQQFHQSKILDDSITQHNDINSTQTTTCKVECIKIHSFLLDSDPAGPDQFYNFVSKLRIQFQLQNTQAINSKSPTRKRERNKHNYKTLLVTGINFWHVFTKKLSDKSDSSSSLANSYS